MPIVPQSWQVDETTTTPPAHDWLTTQHELASCDVALLLQGGQTASAPVVKAFDDQTGTDLTATIVSGAASITGTIVTQQIDGAGMTAGRLYRLLWTVTVATGQTAAAKSYLTCVG